MRKGDREGSWGSYLGTVQERPKEGGGVKIGQRFHHVPKPRDLMGKQHAKMAAPGGPFRGQRNQVRGGLG